MKKIFSNAVFNFSCVATLGIAVLFYCFNNSLPLQQNPTTIIASQNFGLSNETNATTSLFDSLTVYARPLLPYQSAMNQLYSKLSGCKTDVDSIDVCSAFVFRVFDFGGTHNVQFPGEMWKGFSFEKMYAYGQFDSGGIYCGQRTRALEKLLQHVGFTDMIEYSAKDLHTFLLVRTRIDEAWIADGYGMWGLVVGNQRIDFVSYLKMVKQNPNTVKYYSLPPIFGLSEDLLSDETFTNLQSKIANGYLDTVSINPFCDTCQTTNGLDWLPKYLYMAEDTSRFKFKLAVKRNFKQWADIQIKGYNSSTLWAAPDSVAQVNYYTVDGTNRQWANSLIQQIATIK